MEADNTHPSDLPKGLAKPAQRALSHAGLLNLEQIAELSERELKSLHGIGPNAVQQIRSAMEEKGLHFKVK